MTLHTVLAKHFPGDQPPSGANYNQCLGQNVMSTCP